MCHFYGSVSYYSDFSHTLAVCNYNVRSNIYAVSELFCEFWFHESSAALVQHTLNLYIDQDNSHYCCFLEVPPAQNNSVMTFLEFL